MATTTVDPTQIQTRLALGDFLGSPQAASQGSPYYASPPAAAGGFNLNMPTYSDMFGQDVSQVLNMLKSIYPAGTPTLQSKELAQQGQENTADLAEQQRQFNQSMAYDYASLGSGGLGGLGSTAAERSQLATSSLWNQAQQTLNQARAQGKSFEDVLSSILTDPTAWATGANIPLIVDSITSLAAGTDFENYVKAYGAQYPTSNITPMLNNPQSRAQAMQIEATKTKLNQLLALYRSLELRQTSASRVLGTTTALTDQTDQSAGQ